MLEMFRDDDTEVSLLVYYSNSYSSDERFVSFVSSAFVDVTVDSDVKLKSRLENILLIPPGRLHTRFQDPDQSISTRGSWTLVHNCDSMGSRLMWKKLWSSSRGLTQRIQVSKQYR
ncbi:hypothetical protein FHG87_012176 [Trinorchestia longiramus]|nr:hypothetical protein FHG87_012176 [Trinorchestia longiramus]